MKKLFFLVIFTLLLVGCETDKQIQKKGEEKPPLPTKKPKNAKKGKWVAVKIFPKLKDYKLNFELLSSKRKFYFGDKVVLTYKLTNVGRKTLLIPEWYEQDALNVSYFYYRYKKRMKKAIPLKKWSSHIPKVKKDSKHMTLQLEPRHSILIDVELPFIKELKGKKRTRKYYFFTKLNLKTVNVRSRIERIRVKKKSEYEAFLEQEEIKARNEKIKRQNAAEKKRREAIKRNVVNKKEQ